MKIMSLILTVFTIGIVSAQKSTLSGTITSEEENVPYAFVYVKGGTEGTSSDIDGKYTLEVTSGENIVIEVSSQGFRRTSKIISAKENENSKLNFELIEDMLGLNEIVVSATRNRVEKHKTAVVVSTISPRLLNATQSISLADGLNFAPGVRVETNCQNCGFTQVRLNGLDGGYTQILLNSRAVFTSLIGVYGLEQIPTNIIEKVEVVRSGGSALFGSNAIAGTVNIITKDPILNTWEIGTNLAFIDGEAVDRVLTFNSSVVADDLKSGFTLY
jgi:outer membrane receptor for ferrienterochelin and colicins